MIERPILYTERLILRPFCLDDAPTVRELAGAYEIADVTLSVPHPYEEGMAEEWIGSHQAIYADGHGTPYTIVRRDDSQLIGAINLMRKPRFDRAEMGYWIGVPFWGQGYCTEAARAIIDYGFRELGLIKIVGTHLTRNPASGRVMTKVGLTQEGTLRQHVKRWGDHEDVAIYGLLRSEWEASREQA